MKTHEIAKALSSLTKILRNLPNQEIEDFGHNFASQKDSENAKIVVSLAMLASLSQYGKAEWTKIIEEYKLPIEVRPRDAARDVLGKVLKYLEENHDERARVTREAQTRTRSSSELNSALSFLLKNG